MLNLLEDSVKNSVCALIPRLFLNNKAFSCPDYELKKVWFLFSSMSFHKMMCNFG